uniref:Predicted nuclease of the RNAse H fold, HicB family n=1 Tax=Candidatus Kentrum sp. LPFa TaxID=2126335 RepID=A0A450WNV4_9GAMM|nr:MAG: Predicted nuclease of the RNAse H fold, HicB family [Candidatus Kentron sp. LPFa]VFK33018.1 MAG: Predicted nuclease of the RNAse H fold, HicB family [Candidatus Kentron sp. LPFa]
MQFTVETEQENDGRWIAEITDIPGAMKYGKTRDEAIACAEALALRTIAERIETDERPAEHIHIFFAAAFPRIIGKNIEWPHSRISNIG